MPNLFDFIRNRFTSMRPLPAGIHHYQAPPTAALPYRLHLRLEPDGQGILVVNASTVLHLNHTAAEYAYYLVRGWPSDEVARVVSQRYRVGRAQAAKDFQDLTDRLQALISTPDLDPVTYLDFDRREPYSTALSAPYRLDCALTYRVPAGATPDVAPTDRVTQELTAEQWKAVMDKAWAAGIPHVIFTGGEPTLRDDLPELIGHTERVGLVVGLLTDGLRLAEAAYLNALLQSGLDHLMILLQPADEKSWRAVSNALAADVFTVVHLTLTAQNVDQADGWLQRLANLTARAVSLSASEPALNDKLSELRNRAAQLGLSLVWDLPVPYSAFNPVALETETAAPGAGRAWLYVEPDGDVLPAQGHNHVLGNLLNDPWAQIWDKTNDAVSQTTAE